MTPLVSAVMPVYNERRFLADAIQSILDQSFEDFEFIIINDGSTDETADIVRSFSDRRIVFIDNKINAGQSVARNQGLSLAQGKYIAMMDADGISLPERFQMQVDFLENSLDVGVLGTAFFGLKGVDLQHSTHKPISHLGCLQSIMVGCPFLHPTVMMRKSAIPAEVRYDTDYLFAEDIKLWIDLSKHVKMANLQHPLCQYRIDESSVSVAHYNEQRINGIKVRREFITGYIGDDLANKYQLEISWLLEKIFQLKGDSKIRLENISSFYDALEVEHRVIFDPFFSQSVARNVDFVEYRLGDRVSARWLQRYFRYRLLARWPLLRKLLWIGDYLKKRVTPCASLLK